ncbi:glycoside hydrolase [Bifidobacterium sp. DSM 109958]|uniref:Glycoside hydrolase n=1 Tax=Bifidobacterium moraviense TaxID=2675323 RepID=A0A7Y0F309_9BIFI|nr:glycosyl hydrolase family 28 protein [Bifidobacterium sp. DSM 109958]NMN00949.1 glycoside hydrolase [Bifidobacterium sp. DSM 109958]
MDYVITDFGAVPDGVTNNREAIQTAVDRAHEAGGGRVVVPTGRFLSGAIVLRSHVTLHLETGAWLISSLRSEDGIDFAAEFDDDTENAGWEGGCFLFARHAEDIVIEGHGTIYGQGDKVFWDDDSDNGFHECPLAVRGELWGRPRTTYFEDVTDLTVRDVTFRDAAFWTLHMAGCNRVRVEGVRILNDQRAPNNDGIDPDTCKDVVISNCIVVTGDDAIVVKNTPPMAKRYGACENVVISNCVLASRDSALKVGTETGSAIRNVILSDCVFRDCSRGVGIWVRDGATVEDIHVHHVSGATRQYADSYRDGRRGGWWGKGEPIFVSATPRARPTVPRPGVIRNVTFDHIAMTCESCVFIAGEEDAVIENVRVSDLDLTMRAQGTQPARWFDEQPSARGLYEHEIPAVYVRHADDVRIEGTLRREGAYADTPIVLAESARRVHVNLAER